MKSENKTCESYKYGVKCLNEADGYIIYFDGEAEYYCEKHLKGLERFCFENKLKMFDMNGKPRSI